MLAKLTESVDAQSEARDLLHAVMELMREIAAELRRSSPTQPPLAPAQYGTLRRIAGGPCTLSELARYQAVSLPTVSKSVDALVRRGWVERWIDETDRRQTLVRLTEAGHAKVADVKGRAAALVAARLTRLSSSEREQLVAATELLTRIVSAPE